MRHVVVDFVHLLLGLPSLGKAYHGDVRCDQGHFDYHSDDPPAIDNGLSVQYRISWRLLSQLRVLMFDIDGELTHHPNLFEPDQCFEQGFKND